MSLLADAVSNNVAWCALVSGPGVQDATNGVWCTVGEPPPLFPDAVTLRPGVSTTHLVSLLADRSTCSVKDSFADVNLEPYGFRLLFEARWIGHPPRPAGNVTSWKVVADSAGLASWCVAAELARPLPAGLLHDRSITVLAANHDDQITGGAVLNRSAGAVGLSNVFAVDGDPLAVWPGVLAVVGHRAPGLPVVGYEHHADLDAALAVGFADLGPLRVWHRSTAD